MFEFHLENIIRKFFWLSLLEEGGTVFTFEGAGKKCPPTTSLRVHSPQFYWKVLSFTLLDIGVKLIIDLVHMSLNSRKGVNHLNKQRKRKVELF